MLGRKSSIRGGDNDSSAGCVGSDNDDGVIAILRFELELERYVLEPFISTGGLELADALEQKTLLDQ